MKRLCHEIAGKVRFYVKASVAGLARGAELRSMFSGPPPQFLREVFDVLMQDKGIEATLVDRSLVTVPVVMPERQLPEGHLNPRVGDSGICTAAHLMDLRNSHVSKIFLALVPPGFDSNLSLASTRTDFGVSLHANSGSATTVEWIRDAFIQELIEDALSRTQWPNITKRDDGKRLIERAIAEADDLDKHEVNRTGAWRLLARVWSISDGGERFRDSLSLACGFPPCDGGTIDFELQESVLGDLADRLQDAGFHSGIEGLKEKASEVECRALDELLRHLQQSCPVPPAFPVSPTCFYGPNWLDDEIGPAPDWWQVLTAETIQRLLEDDKPRPGRSIKVECLNSIATQPRGIVPIVEHTPQIRVTLPDGIVSAKVLLERDVGGHTNHREWLLDVVGFTDVEDERVPEHRTPIRYTATAKDEELKEGSCRVVALSSWAPGYMACARTATKATVPKPPRSRREKITFESSLTLTGVGRHYIDLFVRNGAALGPEAIASDEGGDLDESRKAPITQVGNVEYAFELDASNETFVQFTICRPWKDRDKEKGRGRRREEVPEEELVRIYVSCDQVIPESCGSEFDRLIRLNRARHEPKATSDVHVERQLRACDLQTWMLSADAAARSFYPFVLAPDYAQTWRKREWASAADTIFSKGRFLNDPRPTYEELCPPEDFIARRVEIAERVRGDDENGLLEAFRLGELCASNSEFPELLEAYLRSYLEWLEAAPNVAPWCDIGLVTRMGADGRTLIQEPDAIVVSPLHPVRLAWHGLAQRSMYLAQRRNPCPAASILDPDCIPDCIVLPIRTAAGGYKAQVFFSVECSSDYWSVLWNADKLDDLARRGSSSPPLDREFGVVVGGISSGFSSSQVGRALGDVQAMLSAKPVLTVGISSASGQNDACNDGVMSWARKQFAIEDEGREGPSPWRAQAFHVFDERQTEARPEETQIANLAEDTQNAVKWYLGTPSAGVTDLGVIAQLGSSNPSREPTSIASPLAPGALIRFRIREQLRTSQGAFICESRMGAAGPPTGDGLADKCGLAIARLENMGEARQGYTFAPDVQAIEASINRSEFVAVSSSVVDPACFLGGWLEHSYLWDYDLPSYSSRAGDSNGYYLLSRIRQLDRDALRSALLRIKGQMDAPDELVDQIMLEVARRGIPTVRGLSAGDTGACGAVGVFLASRLLQDEFRAAGGTKGLLPVWTESDDVVQIALVVPVDPFQEYLNDLTKAVKKDGAQRPDLVVIGLRITESRITCRISPIEVKFRGANGIMMPAACKDALQQNSSLAMLLRDLSKRSDEAEMVLWKVAFQHLLATLVGFGFRVYSQHAVVVKQSRRWAEHHCRVVGAILAEELTPEIDDNGRLIVIDGSTQSGARDFDDDGFKETLVLTHEDAGEILKGDAERIYQPIRAHLRDWRLLPAEPPKAHLTVESRANLNEHPAMAGNSAATVEPATPIESPPKPDTSGTPAECVLPTKPDSGGAVARETDEPPVEPPPAPTPTSPSARPARVSEPGSPRLSRNGIRILVGATVDGFSTQERFLQLSDTNLTQLNCGVVGNLGTGKTQLLKSIVYQLTSSADSNEGVTPNVLIFDYKKDYSAADFVEATHAKVVKPTRLPLNIFDISGVSDSTAPWLDRMKFFADVLDKIYSGIGPVQRATLKSAVRVSYEVAEEAGRQPTIYDVHDNYQRLTGGKADAVFSIIDDLVDLEVFSTRPGGRDTFAEFLKGVVVVDLASLGQDDRTKNMLVAIFLNLFYEHMLRIPKRPYIGESPKRRVIDSFLLVDEADNIMRYEFDVLRKVLLQGREFGVGVILASQYLRHFKAGATDYREPLLSWFIHSVPSITAQELAGLGLPANVVPLADRIRSLGIHECMFKSYGVPGEIIKGLPFFALRRE